MPPQKNDDKPDVKLLKLFRLFLLSSRPYCNADISKKFDWNEATTGRILKKVAPFLPGGLQETQVGRKTYYQYAPKNKHTWLNVDYEEVRYLNICRALATEQLPNSITNRIDETIEHIAHHLAEEKERSLVNSAQVKLGFSSKGKIDYSHHQETIHSLLKACEEKIVCEVYYEKTRLAPAKIYLYAPDRITRMNNAFYLLGHKVSKRFYEKGRATQFSVHRIRKVNLLNKHFNFLPDSHDTGAFGMHWHEPRTFTIRFERSVSDYILDRTWSNDQKSKGNADGSIQLTLTTTSEPELLSWVRSFGDKAQIIFPPNFS